MRRLAFVLVGIGLLAAYGCGNESTPVTGPGSQQTQSVAVPPVASDATATTTESDPLPSQQPTANEPAQVVRDFLAAVDNNSPEAYQYLGGGLRIRVQGGEPLPIILGIPDMYTSSEVHTDEEGNAEQDSATIVATLEYPGGSADRVFTLTRAEEDWKISSIGEAGEGSRSRFDHQQTVEAFLEAFKMGTPDEQLLEDYFSQGRRMSAQPANITGLMQLTGAELEGYTVEQGKVSDDATTATVPATLKAGGKESGRTFTLVFEGEAWRIDRIEVAGATP